jgi:hypothetical protein
MRFILVGATEFHTEQMRLTPYDDRFQREKRGLRFDVLYARLKSIHDLYIDIVFKATAAFLLVTGWGVTSDAALKFLRRDRATLCLAIACLLVYAGLYLLASLRTAQKSRQVSERLADLDYMPAADYSDVIVPNFVALTFGAANAFMCLAVAIFLYRAST